MAQKGYDQSEHPELQEGEVWIINSDTDFPRGSCFKTLRCGKIAYGVDGKPVKGLHPWFASKDEVEEHLTQHRLKNNR
jgi:hypothetical protein